MWVPNLLVFVVGCVVTRTGAGLVFRGALVTASNTASPQSRAEVLSGFFLGAYIGLSIPVIRIGIAVAHVSARVAMLVFVVFVAIAIVWSLRDVTGIDTRSRDVD
jgi:hypothetical protein